MNTHSRRTNMGRFFGAAVIAAMLATPVLTYADDPVTMAPPMQADGSDPGAPAGTNDASQDSVFDWSEVPANQNVPITRAVFDQGGYQLYDSVGETIVVPFTDNNLYVMKFGLSDNGTTYFVNDGSDPILYVPPGAYLENATVPGAKWYPFPQDYQPTAPVFLGVAPSWDDYVNMGWYPDMVCYGGYYCNGPFFAGIHLFPTIGLTFVLGGHDFHDWGGYHSYADEHAAPFHIGFHDQAVYHWANHSYAQGRTFGGGHAAGPAPGYHGVFDNGGFHASGGHQFRGGGYGTHDGGTPSGGNHDFGGQISNQPSHTNGGFSGGHSYTTPSSGGHTFNNGNSGRAGSGGRSFGGSQSSGSRHPRGGNSSVSTDHSGHSSSGNSQNSGSQNGGNQDGGNRH